MINVGIIGCGFVGGALKEWLEHNNPECKLFISDPAKGYTHPCSGSRRQVRLWWQMLP